MHSTDSPRRQTHDAGDTHQPTANTAPRVEAGALLRHELAPLDSDALLGGEKTVAIRHNGAIYRLQATRQGKLILTK